VKSGIPVALFLTGLFVYTTPSMAQDASLAQKVQQVKQLMLANKQQLSHYTWQMQETVSVNGGVKEQSVYQIQLGPDGQQVRTLIAQPVAPSSGGRQHGIIHRVKEDFKAYAQQVGALAKSYSPLNPAKIQQLYARGSVTVKSPGSPGYSTIRISNYLKQGDAIALTLRNNPKTLTSIDVYSYLAQPSDFVTMQVRFASLPDGTRYASTTTVNGQSKNLTIVDRSMNFTPRTR
jgi:hypothetical protein